MGKPFPSLDPKNRDSKLGGKGWWWGLVMSAEAGTTDSWAVCFGTLRFPVVLSYLGILFGAGWLRPYGYVVLC